MKSRNHLAKLLAVSLLTMCSVSSVVRGAAATFTVDSNADTADGTAGDGICGQVMPATTVPLPPPGGTPVTPASQVPGTCTLRAAIQEANANVGLDTIDMTTLGAQTRSITLTSGLPAITEPVIINATVASGALVTVNGNNQFSALQFTPAASGTDRSAGNSSITGLTVTAALNNAATGGGAIYFGPTFPSRLTLTNVVLSSSSALAGTGPGAGPGGPGGGVAVSDGNALVMSGGSITANKALRGGGIAVQTLGFGPVGKVDNALTDTSDDVLTLDGVVLRSNSATVDHGGAIYANLDNGGDIKISNVDIGGTTAAAGQTPADANTAVGDGGGLWVRATLNNSDLLIDGSTIRNNTAANGAGITVKLGTLQLSNSTLSANAASASGGGVWLDSQTDNISGGVLRSSNATFSGNTAVAAGGAIAAKATNPMASSVIHSTLADNTAAAKMGGGISGTAQQFPGSFSAPFTSNIFANTTGGNCRVALAHTDSSNAGFEISTDTTCGFLQASDREGTNPLIGALSNKNSPTTRLLPLVRPLLTGSPAIDAANPSFATLTDERGADRQDGGADNDPTNGPAQRDIGAYEFGGYGLVEFFNASTRTAAFSVDENNGPAMVIVRRTGAGSAAISSTITVQDLTTGTATSGTDYTAIPGNAATLSLSGASPATATLPITITNDRTVEPNETINLALATTAAAAFNDIGSRNPGTVTIKDVENGTFQFSPLTYTVSEGAGMAALTVTRTNGTAGRAKVTFSTGDSTCTPAATCRATADTDYTKQTAQTVTFEDGAASATINIPLTDDVISEMAEQFTVTLASVACVDAADAVLTGSRCDAALNATAANNTATVSIMDNDGALALSIGDATATETESTQTLSFTVMLNKVSSSTVTVNYATANGPGGQAAGVATACPATTTPNSDYVTQAATLLTFAPGETTKTVNVTLCGDTAFEGDETFFVNLSGETVAGVDKRQGVGTIVENDATPTQGSVGFAASSISQTTVEAATTNKPSFVVQRVGNNGTSSTVSVGFTVSNPGYSTFTNNAACDTTATGPDYRISSTNAATGTTGTVVVINTNGTGTITYNGSTNADATLMIEACNDTRRESDQIVTIKLGTPSNSAAAGASTAMLTIQSDEKPRFQISPATLRVREGDDTMASFSVQLLDAIDGEQVCIPYTTTDGTAKAGSDYTAISSPADPCTGSLVWKNGDSDAKPLTVMIVDDGDMPAEGDENFTLDLKPANGVTLVTPQSAVTIASLPRIYFNPKSYVSTGETGTITFEVMRTSGAGTSSAEYVITSGSGDHAATLGTDFTTTPANGVGTVSFAAGETGPKTVTVTVTADTLIEGDETFDVRLRNPTNATLSPTTTTPVFVNGTIQDDDYRFEFSTASSTVDEDAMGNTVNAVLTVKRVGRSLSSSTVSYSTADGTATAGSDYTAANAVVLTFAAGADGDASSTQTISLPITVDTTDETDENFTVTLANPSTGGALGSPITHTVTITDNDEPPTLSIAPVSIAEGDMGSKVLTFTATLSAASGKAVMATATTADGSAKAGSDYSSNSQLLMFPAGTLTQTFEVTISGDVVNEADETFTVTLSNPSNATFAAAADATATGTITNDDAAPTVSIGDASVTEGSGGSTILHLPLTLSALSGQDVTVTYSTADGSATAGSDYTAVVNGTATIAANSGTTGSVDIIVTADELDELDETLAVMLSGATNATVGTAQATGTILDDDAAPSISVNNVSSNEGNSGTSSQVFTVALSAASAQTVTVNIATEDGSAIAGSDYTAVGGVLSFAPGETSKAVSVLVQGDVVNEANETYVLRLSAPTNATLANDSGMGTIVNDDAQPSLSIADASTTEGSDGAKTQLSFTVLLSAASSQAVTADYGTANGTAIAGEDYTTSAGSITIPAGQTSATVTVPVVADNRDEQDETLTVTLSNVVNASIGRAQATATILDDDTAPSSASATDSQGRTLGFSTSAGGFEGLSGTGQPVNAPTTLVYDNGFYTYTIAGLANGGSATVTVTLPAGSSATSYVNCPSDCVIGGSGSGTTVSITVVDGGPGDADGVVNGRILIKAGAGGHAPVATPTPAPRSNGGGGGGSFGGSALLMLGGLFGLRRRKLA